MESRARQLWLLTEPLHAVTYFDERCRGIGRAMGLRGFWQGYFAARTAPLGPAAPALVTSVLTVFALDLGVLIGGAVITETVFGWHGMGVLIVDAITKKEPWLVQGWMMVTAAIIIGFNLLADLVYAYLDPRIRIG